MINPNPQRSDPTIIKIKLSFILFEDNAAIAGEAVIKTHAPDIVQTVINFKKFVFSSSNLLSLPSFITL